MFNHFFTAPFYFASIWFKVQGSRFKGEVAASPPFFRRGYSRIAAFSSRECYYVKRQNVLGSPSGELPEGVVQANWIFRSEATRKSSETPFRTK